MGGFRVVKNYAYARISTKNQNTDRQMQALSDFAKQNKITFTHVFVDKQSGKDFNRPDYQLLKSTIRAGDVLLIKELDRLGRNYEEIKQELLDFKSRGIKVIVLDLPILDNIKDELLYSVMQDIIISIMGYVAQKEREKIQTRVKEGLEAARAKGIRFGRPSGRMFPENFEKYYKKYKANELTAVDFAKIMGWSRATLYRYIAAHEAKGGKTVNDE